jgi:MerR family transcriptional regulator/heat shock protein HspR
MNRTSNDRDEGLYSRRDEDPEDDRVEQETMRRPRMPSGASFTISIVAGMIGVHQQTLRHYERLGLVQPRRGEGKNGIRYYSPTDVERLTQIKRLLEDLHVNLAGVEVILHMNERMTEMQRETEQRIAAMAAEHEQEKERYEREIARLKDIIARSIMSR